MTDTVRSVDGTTIAFERVGGRARPIVVAGALSDGWRASPWRATRIDAHRHRRPARPRRPGATPSRTPSSGIEDIAALIGTRVVRRCVRPFLGAVLLRGRAGPRDRARALRAAVLRRRQPAAQPRRAPTPTSCWRSGPPGGRGRDLHDRVGRRAAASRRRDARGSSWPGLVALTTRSRTPYGSGRHDERQPCAVGQWASVSTRR